MKNAHAAIAVVAAGSQPDLAECLESISGLFPSSPETLVLDNSPDGLPHNIFAGFPFATQAMLGPKVLDVAHYPTITFTSRSLSIGSTSARISGDLTIRGVTRPVSLGAQVFRQRGTEAGDRSKLSVHVTGRVRRSEFGATGWSDMVGDEINLNILVRIDRAEG